MQIIDRPSPNFNQRPPGSPIDILLMHYTGMRTGEEAIARLCDPAAQVSAHYVVEEDGRVFRLVAEDARAWHAGRSRWAGAEDINSRSIGIEIVNPGHEFGYRDFPEAQIDAVIALAQEVLARHAIPAHRVIAHSDVAPDRKEDPGERFPWRRLAEAGVGLWPFGPRAPLPVDFTPDLAHLIERLERIGYGPVAAELEAARATIAAFQRHWLPEAIGAGDEGLASPRTLAMASAVAALIRKGHGEY